MTKVSKKIVRFFLDTEFAENEDGIDLISVALVCENGQEYYAVSSEFAEELCNDWVTQNVLPQLGDGPRKSLQQIKGELLGFVHENCCVDFVDGSTKPQFIGYYSDYDWVVLCRMFGTMMDLPKLFPMWCYDLKQRCWDLGDPRLPEQGKGEHNALSDARWNRDAWQFLDGHELSLEKSKRLPMQHLDDILKIQCMDGNWNHDPYMMGLANGLIMARATLLDEPAEFKRAPRQWLLEGLDVSAPATVMQAEPYDGEDSIMTITQRICDLLRRWPNNEMTPKIIAQELGIANQQANACIQRLYRDGKVVRTCPGWYACVVEG